MCVAGTKPCCTTPAARTAGQAGRLRTAHVPQFVQQQGARAAAGGLGAEGAA